MMARLSCELHTLYEQPLSSLSTFLLNVNLMVLASPASPGSGARSALFVREEYLFGGWHSQHSDTLSLHGH